MAQYLLFDERIVDHKMYSFNVSLYCKNHPVCHVGWKMYVGEGWQALISTGWKCPNGDRDGREWPSRGLRSN
jgi:hypothetical protein